MIYFNKSLDKFNIPKIRCDTTKWDPSKFTLENLDRFIGLLQPLSNSESDSLFSNAEEVRQATEVITIQILKSVSHVDTEYFDKKRLKSLNKLTTYANAECVLAILGVFEMFGTEVNLPAIKSLIKGQRITGRNPEIKKRAELCLQAINARLENRKDKFSLLHPIMDYDPRELLRPNSTNPKYNDSQELLRANSESPIRDFVVFKGFKDYTD